MLTKRRLAYALAISIVLLFLALCRQLTLPLKDGDLYYAFCEARAVLDGTDPYSVCLVQFKGGISPTYPLTAALFVIPLLPLQPYAAPFFFAFTSGLLAFALLRQAEYWRLLLFLSAPFFYAWAWFQWTPFVTALYLIPSLLPLALVKPNIAAPIVLLRLNRNRFLGLAAFIMLSIIIDPTWPLRWWHTIGHYDGVIPLLVFPFGTSVLLALVCWRKEWSRLLLLLALAPQRGIYDFLPLFLIPASRRQMLMLVAASWITRIVALNQLFPDADWLLYPLTLALVFQATAIAKLRRRRGLHTSFYQNARSLMATLKIGQ